MISLAVVIYQIIIFAIVYLSKGDITITILAYLWTATHVFYPPLMMLQGVTITVALFMGRAADNEKK